jgi:long-chain acyl-CoA synthetase
MYGFAFEFMYAFCIGSHMYYLTKAPSPSVVLKAFAEVRPRIVIAVPLIIEKIVQNKVFPVIRAVQMRSLLMLPIVRDLIYRKIRRQLE